MRLTRAIRILGFLGGLLLASLACAEMRPPRPEAPPTPFGSPSQPEAPLDVAAAAAQLRAALKEEVPHLLVDRPAGRQAWISRSRAAIVASGLTIDRPQILVVIDRNPRVQQIRLILAQPQGEWDDLGGTKVSTGRPGRPITS
jgi:hypothetical protein